MLDVRMLWLSELTIRDYERGPSMSATKMWPMNCDFRAHEVCTNFRRGLLQRGDEPEFNLSRLTSHYASSSLRYLWDVWPFGICVIMKAHNVFLVIQKQMTLKVYNVWKLHRPCMSHDLLADNVDSLLYTVCTGCGLKNDPTPKMWLLSNSWQFLRQIL